MTPSNPAPVGDERDSRKSGEPSEEQVDEIMRVCMSVANRYAFVGDAAFPRGREKVREVLARFGTRPAAEPPTAVMMEAAPATLAQALEQLAAARHEADAFRDAWQVAVAAAEPSQSGSAGDVPAFEKWLRTVCFQKPTPEAYDLAKDAWNAALSRQAPAAPAEAYGAVMKHRLMRKVDGVWVAASEYMTGLPDSTWVKTAHESPEEWRIDYARRWTGTQVADGIAKALATPAEPAKTEAAEEIEAVIACLGDDAASIRADSGNDEDERAANMERAAELLAALSTPPTPEAEPVQQDTRERFLVIRESHHNAAETEYFSARPHIDTADRRRVFYAGFCKGYDAKEDAS